MIVPTDAMIATVIHSIVVPAPITPAEPLPALPEIPCGSVVIVEGRAPIWRYGRAPLAQLASRSNGPLRSTPVSSRHAQNQLLRQVLIQLMG